MLGAATLLLGVPAASQMTQSQQLDAARSISRLLGLSPAGTELWARQSLKRARNDELDKISAVELEIGRELARSTPDRARLDTLVERFVVENAAIERRRKLQELADAFEHTPADRQQIGRFIADAVRDANNRGAVLQPLP
ncbi:hypothetical protein [Sphingomonas guangdongensis]|nr:hypothetical protein [Sphingomonas guangdongensis]